MVAIHLKRILKPKNILLITLILLGIVFTSYYFTAQDHINWVRISQANAPDIDYSFLADKIAGYNGLSYFFNFLFSADMIVVFSLLFTSAVIFFIGSALVNDISTDRGTLIITRMGFSKYLRGNILAQILFTFAYLFVFFLLLFVGSYFIHGNLALGSGITTNFNLGISGNSLLPYFGVMALQVINISLITTSLAVLGTLMSVVHKNKFIVQLFALLYYFITLVLAGTVGQLNGFLERVFTVFVLDNQLLEIPLYFSKRQFDYKSFLVYFTAIILISLALYRVNIKRFGRNYII